MYVIADRRELTRRDMISLTVEAPQVARTIVPGQFVVLRVNETGERVPLTVAYKDAAAGTITIIFQVVGKSTALLASLGRGRRRCKRPVRAPGRAGHVRQGGHGGGHRRRFGHRRAAPPAAGAPEAGNRLVGIIGARERTCSSSSRRCAALCDELVVTTDDGSYGMHGKVTDALQGAGGTPGARGPGAGRRSAR